MKFFIPRAKDDQEAEAIWQEFRTGAEEWANRPVGNSRIYRLEYTHDGERQVARVGQPLYGGEVIAIFESEPYLIYAVGRGFVRGTPVMVGQKDVRAVETFESPTE